MTTPNAPLPCSRSALDKLGKRLATQPQLSAEDQALLRQVLVAYDNVLVESVEKVRDVCAGFHLSGGPLLQTTPRLKTIDTIREKLQREQGMGLKGMQDIAGIRVVGDLSRGSQNELAEMLMSRLATSEHQVRLIDRRVNPSHGYRAIHLIARVDTLPLEIQIRTHLQDAWAQTVERFADVWGRSMRYGGQPDNPSMKVAGNLTRAQLLKLLLQMSDQVEDHSLRTQNWLSLRDRLDSLGKSSSTRTDELGEVNTPKDFTHAIQSLRAEVDKSLEELDHERGSIEELFGFVAIIANQEVHS